MEELENEIIHEEETVVSDEEFSFDYSDLNINNREWVDEISPNESVSQISRGSEASSLTLGSTVWSYFERNPSYAQGFNVCKRCSTKYRLSTSVTTLRKHLEEKHQLKTPVKKNKVFEVKKHDPFEKDEQKEYDNHLIQWIICDLQPFTIVENNHFKKFIGFFCPRYTIPDRRKVKGLVYL
jgi:hypothetical protein